MHGFSLGMALCTLVQCASMFDSAFAGSDPFADTVLNYNAGPSPSPGYTNSAAALGAPERFTGEGIFPSVVSPFSPPFGTDEIVSISPGGHITLAFAEPVTNDPNNLYGIDVIIFNNAAFIDGAYPGGVVGGAFGDDGGIIEVSENGMVWFTVAGNAPDDLMPTLGYLDGGPYDASPGNKLTDFTRPVDPSLTLTHMLGLNLEGLRTLYRGSGGGVGIDLTDVGLSHILFVRISNPAGAAQNIEIDAVADVSPSLHGDVDLDGAVNVDDLLAVISNWGAHKPGDPPADFNHDGFVDVDDLLAVIVNWTGGR